MFGSDADANNPPSQNNNTGSYAEYLTRAAQACANGDDVLGMHLYLAAYERAIHDSYVADPVVIDGMRRAWQLACQCKERSLAEYIFEKLEPYLSTDEVTQCASQLQRLALDKLEEFGLTQQDLEEMTEMISHDFFGMDVSPPFLMQVDTGMSPLRPLSSAPKSLFSARPAPSAADHGSEPIEVQPEGQERPTGQGGLLQQAGQPAPVPPAGPGAPVAQAGPAAPAPPGAPGEPAADGAPVPDGTPAAAGSAPAAAPAAPPAPAVPTTPSDPQSPPSDDGLSSDFLLPALSAFGDRKPFAAAPGSAAYNDLVGYDSAIKTMHSYGIGMQDDAAFDEFIRTLNVRHGLSGIPLSEAFLFRSAAREDANQFMLATVGEMQLPTICMRMEENLQGMPVLCVMTSSEDHQRLSLSRNALENGGVLVIEDIDLWGPPLADFMNDDMGPFFYMHLSRGAREAIGFIRSAIENPEVHVFLSAAQEEPIDGFFLDLLEPLTVIDIDLPDDGERTQVWLDIAQKHPSLYAVENDLLVRYSAGMSRFDIYMAAREAVEEAYKASLLSRTFVPVKSENIFEKIALYQPLESDEYLRLEDAVIEGLKEDLDNLDDLLKGLGD